MSTQLEEIWRPIEGYDGLYEVSNLGRIYSYPRERTKGGYGYGNDAGYGYKRCCLDRRKKLFKQVHILVYETFVGSIPTGYEIHHKNFNPSDNRLENLELLSREEHQKLHLKDKYKKVRQYTLEGQFVAEYESLTEASKQTNIPYRNISNVCLKRIQIDSKGRKHKFLTAGGFKWEYAA